MRPALKAALDQLRALLLAAAAGGAGQLGGQAQAAVAPAEREQQQELISAAEQKVWAEAQQANTAEAYQRYLELFPTGQFAEDAFRFLIERSLTARPVEALVDIEPTAGPGDLPRERLVAAADLALY
jgi:hypothetical protein